MKLTSNMQAAIDFGISNTDTIAQLNGEWRRWTKPYIGQPTPEVVRTILAAGGITLEDLSKLAVTGGRHRLLPAQIDQCSIVGVGELQAIGRGGQAAGGLTDQDA